MNIHLNEFANKAISSYITRLNKLLVKFRCKSKIKHRHTAKECRFTIKFSTQLEAMLFAYVIADTKCLHKFVYLIKKNKLIISLDTELACFATCKDYQVATEFFMESVRLQDIRLESTNFTKNLK